MKVWLISVIFFIITFCSEGKDSGQQVKDEEIYEMNQKEVGTGYFCTPEEKCDDENPCTKNDTCINGECIGEPYSCDDNIPCTNDVCLGNGECKHEIKKNFCLINKKCYKAGEIADDNVCLKCDPDKNQEGFVNNDGKPCDDSNECTKNDVCKEGKCVGVEIDCDDNNICTYDFCDKETGKCNHENINVSCEDGDLCTEFDKCEDGLCVPGEEKKCDDNNICTKDYCDPEKGCVFEKDPAACDDGNDCTLDFCNEDEQKCEHQKIEDGTECDDGNVCTVGDHCMDGKCVSGDEVIVCDDNNICTDDYCDEVHGCVYKFNEIPCDDGFACTKNDHCVFGQCVGNDDECSPCYGVDIGDNINKAVLLKLGDNGYPGEALDIDDNIETCAPPGKCSDGINNALGSLAAILNPSIKDGMDKGSFMLLLEFKDIKFDKSNFTVNVYYGVLDENGSPPDCAVDNPDCYYFIPPYNFTPDCMPKVSVSNMVIDGNKFFGGGKDYTFTMYLPLSSGVTVEFTVLWGRIEGTISYDPETGKVLSTNGIVGGVIPKKNLYDAILNIPDEYFPLPKDVIITILDANVVQDVDVDGDGENDASSIGIRFETMPAKVSVLK